MNSENTSLFPSKDNFMQPVELRATFPMELHDGHYATTTEVWSMLSAARAGDLATVRSIVECNPAMVRCEHNYMPPLQLAVREGHTAIAAYLLEHGAYDPKFETYPFRESIHQMAQDREFTAIASLLEKHRVAERPRGTSVHGPGHIDFTSDPAEPDRQNLEKLINADALTDVEALAEARPGLVTDPLLFWGEGALAMSTNRGRERMIELLLRLGARVPDVAKWAPYYYFKHLEVAQLLINAGMSARHTNWHRTTLLHSMAWLGDAPKVTLLLDHGAEIDAIDDEFRSTPLGLAAKAGRMPIVRLLLERGADPNKSGAGWATPAAWARKRGHTEIHAELRQAGASDSL